MQCHENISGYPLKENFKHASFHDSNTPLNPKRKSIGINNSQPLISQKC